MPKFRAQNRGISCVGPEPDRRLRLLIAVFALASYFTLLADECKL